MWNTLKWSLLGLIVVLLIGLSGVAGYAINDNNSGSSSQTADAGEFGILNEVQGILKQDFVNPDAVKDDVLQKGAIDGMIASLNDPHSTYIPPQDFQNGIDIITGSFEGIGANVDQDPVTREIVIISPFRDSPAEKAGIQAGDVILAVDGESTSGWSVADAVRKIRGQQGTPVTLTVRHKDRSQEDINIVRATVAIPTVFVGDAHDSAGNVVPDVAYIQIQQFTDATVGDMRNALDKIKQDGKKGLIVDLRGNPGGGLDATVSIADMFIDDGIILTQVDREGNKTVYNGKSGGEATDIPIAILVDKNSASGSEVLSGALRDHGRAQLIGQQTFGKGSVNHLRDLSNGGAIYVSIARWLTPNGTLIEGVGLSPDVRMDPTESDAPGKEGPELFTAIDLLHSEINGTAFVPPATSAPTPTPVATGVQ
jgi:carboxyl-terminal processing protease